MMSWSCRLIGRGTARLGRRSLTVEEYDRIAAVLVTQGGFLEQRRLLRVWSAPLRQQRKQARCQGSRILGVLFVPGGKSLAQADMGASAERKPVTGGVGWQRTGRIKAISMAAED
jgi:hypothetical protein